jgi:Tfp pilus assembly protein PilX
MKVKLKKGGSVLLMTIFVIALLAVLTMGILQMNTEELQLMQNQTYAAQALATAEAGLNDSFARIRQGSDPNIASTSFNGGTYTVTVTGTLPNHTITSTAATSEGFAARVKASVTIGSRSPYVIRIDNLRINE